MIKTTKGKLLKITALVIDVGAPLGATLAQFPVWVERSSESTVSGLFIVLAFISCLPFVKYIKSYLRSPAIWSVWLILFVMLFALQNIINEMVVVCFVGLVSNLIGSVIYKSGKKLTTQK